ncbi:MAG: site-specific integrase [Deltaproteobacteria bacterium]|jgi:integrase|nr:site-specific integrase [Deltaproteobacteria bacterium]
MRHTTRYEGVYYRERKAKYNGKPDRTYEFCHNADGKKKWVTVGRASLGVTAEQAHKERLKAMTTPAVPTVPTATVTVKEALLLRRESMSPLSAKILDNCVPLYYPGILDTPVRDLTQPILENWKAGLLPRLAAGTFNNCAAMLRSGINTAKRRGLHEGPNPLEKSSGFTTARNTNKCVRFLSPEEAATLIARLYSRGEAAREWADMAVVSLNSGLRAAELYRLRGQDLSPDGESVSLVGKSGKFEICRLNQPATRVLRERTKSKGPGELIFPTRPRHDSLASAINYLKLNKGISSVVHKVRFHTFRHTFASWLVQRGVDLYVVQKLLRHANPAMTQRYAHLRSDDLKEAMGLLPQLF